MIWLKIKKVAMLLNLTNSAVKKAIAKNKYEYRYVKGKGRGGKQIEILLESLPVSAQNKYYDTLPEIEKRDILEFSEDKRKMADPKIRAVKEWENSKAEQITSSQYIKQWNEENDLQISKRSLYRWQSMLKENNDPTALIDDRNGYNSVITPIDDEVWEYFYSLYMTEHKRSLQLCYDLTVRKYGDKVHHINTFRKKVKQIEPYAIDYYRNGKKVASDQMPYMQRDYTSINSNDIWFSDHHKFDFFIKNANSKPVRPWLTTWSDARSRYIVSYEIRIEDPNVSVVKRTLVNGMKLYGVPKEVYIDNGKDYKAKENFDKDYPYSISNQLGINAIFATKYHGQAKSIERFYRTLEERFSKMFNTYAGSNAKERPESLKDIPISEYPTLEDVKGAFDVWLLEDFHKKVHKGHGMENKEPVTVYFENLKEKQLADSRILELLAGRIEERTVSNNGILMFNNSYFNEALLRYKGEKVIVTYDPENIEKISVFDMKMRAICTAAPKIRTLFRNTSEAEYKEANKRKKAVRKLIKSAAPIRHKNVWQIIAKEKALKQEASLNIESNLDTKIVNAKYKIENIKALNLVKPEKDRRIESKMLEILNNMKKEEVT
ncbi:MAG: Mu transposase C-terminal domain-containing protein [Candidatus Fimenecus sp.]